MVHTPAWAGTWIFIILSGYGIGVGFHSGKYAMDRSGIRKYYLRRLTSIIPLYLVWILTLSICVDYDMLQPGPTHIKWVVELLLFTYQEQFESNVFGVGWYISTVFWLQAIAPALYWILKRTATSEIRLTNTILLIMMVGLTLRLSARAYYFYTMTDTWTRWVYKPPWFNLDLFCGGMAVSFAGEYRSLNRFPKLKKIVAFSVVADGFLLIFSNSYMYRYESSSLVSQYIYRDLFPELYLFLTLMYIYCFDICRDYGYSLLTAGNLLRNPCRIFDCFRLIQYPMYLFHAVVMLSLQRAYFTRMYNGTLMLLRVPVDTFMWTKDILCVVLAFGITLAWSVTFILFARYYSRRT